MVTCHLEEAQGQVVGMRGILKVTETEEHWDHGHQCIHPRGVIECEYGYLTGETAESMMPDCACCDAPLPVTAKRLICPPCAQALRIDINAPHLICRIHARQVRAEELDVIER